MNEELTHVPMKTGAGCTRVAGRSCTARSLRRTGRRSLRTGTKSPKPSFPNGSASDLARSLVTPSPPTMRMRVLLRHHQKKRKKRKRKKKRRRKRKRRKSKREER